MNEIRRLDSISEEQRYMQEGIACVYRPESKNSYAIHRLWNVNWLTCMVGNNTITTRFSATQDYIDPGDDFPNIVRALCAERMTLKQFLRGGIDKKKIMSGTDTYLFYKGEKVEQWGNLWEYVKEVFQSTEEKDELFSSERRHTVGLWMSGCGIRSMLHYDDSGDDNLNVQVWGTKNFLLFPPEDWPHLNTFLAMGVHDFSVYEKLYANPDISSLQQTHPHTVVLEKGDILYIPAQWFHYIEHIGTLNLNLPYWFSSSKKPQKMGQSTRNIVRILKLLIAFFCATCFSCFLQIFGIRSQRL